MIEDTQHLEGDEVSINHHKFDTGGSDINIHLPNGNMIVIDEKQEVVSEWEFDNEGDCERVRQVGFDFEEN